jgi:hypothetical protein
MAPGVKYKYLKERKRGGDVSVSQSAVRKQNEAFDFCGQRQSQKTVQCTLNKGHIKSSLSSCDRTQ